MTAPEVNAANELTNPAHLLAQMPFAVELGISLDHATPREVSGSLPWAPQRCTAESVLHGGAIMAFADAVGAVCAHLNLPGVGANTTTIESKTNFLRALRSGSAYAKSRPLHVGRTIIVVQTNLTDDKDRLLAQTTQSQAVV